MTGAAVRFSTESRIVNIERVVDADLAPEDEPLAVVPGQRHRPAGVRVWASAVQTVSAVGSAPGTAPTQPNSA